MDGKDGGPGGPGGTTGCGLMLAAGAWLTSAILWVVAAVF